MAVTCHSCGARNGDDESSCSLCGASLVAEATTPEREVTATDSNGPAAEATGAFDKNLRGVVVGAKLAGRYLVKEMLGRGGAAMVFRAADESLGEEIALKVFPNLMRQAPAELERFKREILVNRRISHANVIRVHDFGTVGDDAYLTMELLGGGTLADRIEKRTLPIEEAVGIAIGVCDGLHAAHQAGIVHRDVKPENVLFDGAGRPKLVDFGLARLLDATTHTQGFSGTPFYMSPEQANGDEITAQTDVYSLGILMFELFTGQLPFFADSLVRIATLHLKEAPPRPSSLRAGFPALLEELILACLAKAPSERPTGAETVANALRRFLREGGADQARKLDRDSSFSSPRPRPRLPQSDRTQIQAPADVQPRVSKADDPTLDKIEAPSRRETVVARATAREQGSGPRPIPTAREQGSGPRPIPKASDSTGIVRDSGLAQAPPRSGPSELPMPSRELPPPPRDSRLLIGGGIAALAVVVLAAVAIRSGLTPNRVTPVRTLTVALATSPAPLPTLERTTATPAATRERTPAPKPSAKPSATAPLAVPSATQADAGFGEIKVTVRPWVSVFVDGKKQGQDIALHKIQVGAGSHTLRLENATKGFRGEVQLTVREGRTCAFDLNLEKPNVTLVAPPGC